MEGEKMESCQKEDFEVEVFSPLRILTSPLYEETHEAFIFLPLLFYFFFSFFSIRFLSLFLSMLSVLGVLMIFEEKNHFFNNFFSNKMVW
jgi:hypothetical protein